MKTKEQIKEFMQGLGYAEQESDFKSIVGVFAKTYYDNDTDTWAYQKISVNFRNCTARSCLEHRGFTYKRKELENLFIPLNRVKSDEKKLKEFLGNE